MRCPSCHAEAPDSGRYCPACGASLNSSAAETALAAEATRLAGAPDAPTRLASGSGDATKLASSSRAGIGSSSSGWLTSSGSIDHGRFPPGTILDSRYRIIGLLGRGGMGEVYRADDLRLGQPVALKFLPEGLGRDPVRLAQFHNEVRTARQVSHPNVCRMYTLVFALLRHALQLGLRRVPRPVVTGLSVALSVFVFVLVSRRNVTIETGYLFFDLAFQAVMVLVLLLVILRLGLFAAAVASFADMITSGLLVTLDGSKIYASQSWTLLAIVAGLAVAGFWMARGGEPRLARPINAGDRSARPAV